MEVIILRVQEWTILLRAITLKLNNVIILKELITQLDERIKDIQQQLKVW